ncbi:hypothetical protein J1N35_018503 [Gossypium stocksii]|uniref:Uncharacterized protein n=1 Tax=Gossypium stocksii TaxID=47602 RepID=A0A9D3VP62_9ROSI|nr:hypothetical protein J1N35_018503 [Gossypium stocksii]
MADFKGEMPGLKAANQPSHVRSSSASISPATNQPSHVRSSSTPIQPMTIDINVEKYTRKYYNYNKSNMKLGVGDAERKRQRRMVKYNSYAVESRLMSGFRWMKNKCSEIVHG